MQIKITQNSTFMFLEISKKFTFLKDFWYFW